MTTKKQENILFMNIVSYLFVPSNLSDFNSHFKMKVTQLYANVYFFSVESTSVTFITE